MADMLPLFEARYTQIAYDCAELMRWKANGQKRSKQASVPFWKAPAPLPQSVVDSVARLETHAHFKALLQRLLEKVDWLTDDYAGDRLLTSRILAQLAATTRNE
ncbi:hypothetical protein K466DRAFT_602374 [Polyporus arcularius HHB13444]|uniref:Uncharacterized protein n=1 Tax=Polyporus arcularius HHB13444 TaxID=1314778 RepID=A0A5C3PDU6_9APHY|nr:hypothetical protein K466DRAFT_602374 [Polyporus arcularius HHB13444]